MDVVRGVNKSAKAARGSTTGAVARDVKTQESYVWRIGSRLYGRAGWESRGQGLGKFISN